MGEIEYKVDTEQVERLPGTAEAAAADSVRGDDDGGGAGMGRPSFKWSAIRHYAITRFTDLVPTKEYMLANRELLNPFPAVAEIPGKQWRFILCGLAAWTWDSFDFFTVSLNVSQLSEDFNTSVSLITWGITLVLMLRTVGAIVFGYLGDKYGSKWPFVANLAIMCALQIGTGFIKTFHQFLGVRAIFGVVMGGIYGNATATALDDCPVRAKGFISGVLQQGYALGYLLAVVFTRALADTTAQRWRSMFWFAAGVSSLITVSRIVLPQTDAYKKEVLEERIRKESGIVLESFEKKAAKVFKFFWPLLVYMVLLMAGFNFMSHGSQDLYPTFLKEQLGFSLDRSTVTNCVANLGAITGGIIVGHFSNFLGRRLSIMACVVLGGALIYPWTFVRNTGINAAVFFLQFGVQGAFGVVPIHLSELSAPAYEYRAFIVGVAYQLGNLASSASSTIESTLGDQFQTMGPKGKTMQDYGKVMAIFMGAVFAYVLLITFIGPENRAVTVNVHVDHEKEKEKENESVDEADRV